MKLKKVGKMEFSNIDGEDKDLIIKSLDDKGFHTQVFLSVLTIFKEDKVGA